MNAIPRTATDIERRASALVHTSVQDCQSSMGLEDHLPTLWRALEMATRFHQTTRIKILERRIRQLEKK